MKRLLLDKARFDGWLEEAFDEPLPSQKASVREAGDDHFYGPWQGGAKGAGGRPEKAVEAQAWQDPPPKEGVAGTGKAGGYSSDEAYGTNTSLGRAGEKSFVNVVGGEVLHPPGKGEQSPLDVKVGGYGFEVKAVSTRATKYAATPKGYEIAQKEAYAKKLGLKPALAIVVMDSKSGQAHVYYREGLRGGRLSKATGWNYLGSGDAAAIAEALGLVEAGDDHFYGPWKGGSKGTGGRPGAGPVAGEAGPKATVEQRARLDAAKTELDAAKAAHASKPTKANADRLEKARMEATSAWWAAGDFKGNKQVDPKSQLALAHSLPNPSSSAIKAKLPSGTSYTWSKKPKATNLPSGVGVKSGTIVATRPGYKPKAMRVTVDLDGALTVGTPWNEAAMAWVKEDGYFVPWREARGDR